MPTRLSTFCDKLLEAGWLAALILAPLFFDVYSSRVFEPDKIALIRSIALLMVGAWIVKQIETGLPKTSLAESARALVRANPLVLPTLAVVVVYIVTTILSVASNVSFWGSYQRMQGTYTTFSYIVIFLITAGALRTRAQFDRAINTAIVTSFPIALYGIIQHFQLDPLPWGGDTTERIAANMGNAIFVAAYLILIVPLALARWLEALARAAQNLAPRGIALGAFVLALVLLIALWATNFALGAGGALVLLLLGAAVGTLRRSAGRGVVLAATYTVILATQLVALFFSQSRGPWLGLGAGLFAFTLLGALMVMRRLPRVWRSITLGGIIGLAVLAMAFLVVFNLPASPLEALKRVPYLGRLGQILDPASPTARVRELIWEGALNLVLPHQPLWSPTTGDDPFNVIRPLVGYGPEAMYVAFNPFYPAELGRLESRNASPDRSHNETFDSLVMTGLLGFGAYILLFISVFYFGLKWLGLIASPSERNLFIALWLAVGFVFAFIFGAWRGWHWIGVALPAGMIVGFLIYLAFAALRRYRAEGAAPDVRRALWLGTLMAALIAHFVEIHFGIAIVSTRTYFWFYAALLVVVGLNHLTDSAAPAAPRAAPEEPNRATAARRKPRRRAQAPETSRAKERALSPAPVVAWTAIATLILITLAFESITNQTGTASAVETVQRSLFSKSDGAPSGIFVLFGLTWLIAGIIGLTDRLSQETWLYDILLFVILAFTAGLWFAMLQTRWLTTPGDLTDAYINLHSLFYLALFICLGVLALALWFDAPPRFEASLRSNWSALAAPGLLALVLVGVYVTNYNNVRADILYKAGTNYDAAGAWDRSMEAYQRAFDLQPTQDFYALFLGRAYLEGARAATDLLRRTQLINLSEKTLLKAQRLNPLNTDHTANLARLHRIVAPLIDNPTERAEHYRQSSDYYRMVARLSPHTAYLRNEWALTLSQSGDLAQARAQLEQSLQLDPSFGQTYVYLGDVYRAQNDFANAANAYLKALAIDPRALSEADGTLQVGAASVLALPEYAPRAIAAYRAVAQQNPTLVQPHLALVDLYRRRGQLDLAQPELEQAARIAPDDLVTNLALVNFLSEAGQIDAAVAAMRHLMELVPTTRADYARFQDFYGQLQSLQRTIQTAQKSPNDVTARRTLAALWKARGQPRLALPEYQAIARLAPNDYDAYKNLVLLNLQTDHPDDAQSTLVTTVTLAPENEKPFWQNIQVALNAQKAGQFVQAVKAAQAALALAADADKPVLQAYVTLLQEKTANK